MSVVYRWPHKVNGEVIGEIRRITDESGKKKDLVCYKREGDRFLAGIPDHMTAAPLPLFGIDSVTDTTQSVIVCEGQKKQSLWASLGFQSVSNIAGSGSGELADWSSIRPCRKFMLSPDNDKPGDLLMETVWTILSKQNEDAEISVLTLPNIPAKGAVDDWLKMQPELEEWDGLSPLTDHPQRDIIRQRLLQIFANCQTPPPPHWTRKDDWQFPEEMDTRLRPVQQLPINMLPVALRGWVRDTAERMECPIEYVAVSAIAMLGAAMGASVGIRPKRLDDWTVVPNLWGAIIGPPGTLKSAAMANAVAPLAILDKAEADKHEINRKDYEVKQSAYDAKKQQLEKQLKDQVTSGRDEHALAAAEDELRQLDEPPKPSERRFMVHDTTMEALGEIMSKNASGVLLVKDELMELLHLWEREGRKAERPFYLETWNGDSSRTIDRIGRGSLRIENMCLSMIGGIQEEPFKEYLMSASLNDGLIQRFQLAVYPSEDRIESDQIVDRVADLQERFMVQDIVKQLAYTDWQSVGAEKTEHDRRPFFRFNDAAQELYFEWYADLKKKIRTEENPWLAEHLSKYRSLMPSLALIFHVVESARLDIRGPVTAEAADLAAAWCGFLEQHARRIYALAKPREQSAASVLADRIKHGKLASHFTNRDVLRKGWRMLTSPEEVRKACLELIDANWIRMVNQRPGRQGGRPKEEYIVNPLIETVS